MRQVGEKKQHILGAGVYFIIIVSTVEFQLPEKEKMSVAVLTASRDKCGLHHCNYC
jgi:hypothetical protein